MPVQRGLSSTEYSAMGLPANVLRRNNEYVLCWQQQHEFNEEVEDEVRDWQQQLQCLKSRRILISQFVLEIPLAGHERAFCRAFYSLPILPLRSKDETVDDNDTCLNACFLAASHNVNLGQIDWNFFLAI